MAKTEDMVTIVNRATQREYHIPVFVLDDKGSYVMKQGAKGVEFVTLVPGEAVKLPASIAKQYLEYKDLADASKIVAVAGSDALKKENADLKEQLAKAQAEL